MGSLIWRNLGVLSIGIAITIIFPMNVSAYETAFRKTAVGTVEIKTLPPAAVLGSESDGRYFDNSDRLFLRLFGYIKEHEIKMTVPVQADIGESRMLFFVGPRDAGKQLENSDHVRVMRLPERTVVSLGGRGSYSEKNFKKARTKLEEWLREESRFEASGEPYAVYWNGPFVPGFLKRFEVHVPIRVESDPPSGR